MTPHPLNPVAITVFVVLFLLVTVLGFVAGRWRRGDLDQLDQWGLGGRRFGTVVTWFLLGGDIYTAYTFIAVPALVFGAGAIGFFALPYTIVVYPLVFVFLTRLWVVCRRHGYVTPADFVRGRYGSSSLALAVALTGLLATMPYIALQLLGIQVVIAAMGIEGEGIVGDLPLIIAFVILAVYTYQSGLRAPALISIVKDLLIYVTVIVAVIYIPYRLGGFDVIFDAAARELPQKTTPSGAPAALVPGAPAAYTAYGSLVLGSAFALFMYPHVLTGVLSAGSANVIRRNAAILPAYTFVLGLLALLGYMAIAAGVDPGPERGNFVVPDLFLRFFPSWFEGVAFAAIAIGALVPAAVMSIAAANLFTRNVYKEYLRRDATDREQTRVAKITSLAVKLGAVLFILLVPTEYAIDLQLLGGVWIVQTAPAIVIGLYTRWLHGWALFAGWLAGMVVGTSLAYSQGFTPIFPLEIFGVSVPAYHAIYALLVNLVVSVVLSALMAAMGVARGADQTLPGDYEELGETGVEPTPALAGRGA